MSTIVQLTERARFLRNAAPQQFKDFHAVFADYTGQKYKDLVKAEANNFLQMQGQAQQCAAILQALEGVKDG